MRIRAQLLTLLLLVFSIAQCGGKDGLSSKIKFASRNKQPIVVLGDRTISRGTDSIVIKAPWYLWEYSFYNPTETNRDLNVATVIFRTTTTRNGITVRKETTLDPNADCPTGVTRGLLAYVTPGETFSGATGCAVEVVIFHLNPPDYEDWYLSDLGESDSGVYSIEIEAIGWFSKPTTDPDDPGAITERYQAFDFLITQ